MDDQKSLAKRSAYTKLDSNKVEAVIGKEIPSWQSGIDRFLKEYLNLRL
ncbi:sugar nucleotide-binding protein [Thiospirochaeta perfilievii]|nr:sugar nucleotide-binding protein [Thiospirochaeta perfilievii]